MFSATVTIAVGDCPKVIRKATFGARIFRALLHSAIRIMFASLATTRIHDSPRIIRVSAFFAIKVHPQSPAYFTTGMASGTKSMGDTVYKSSMIPKRRQALSAWAMHRSYLRLLVSYPFLISFKRNILLFLQTYTLFCKNFSIPSRNSVFQS